LNYESDERVPEEDQTPSPIVAQNIVPDTLPDFGGTTPKTPNKTPNKNIPQDDEKEHFPSENLQDEQEHSPSLEHQNGNDVEIQVCVVGFFLLWKMFFRRKSVFRCKIVFCVTVVEILDGNLWCILLQSIFCSPHLFFCCFKVFFL